MLRVRASDRQQGGRAGAGRQAPRRVRVP